MAKPKISIIAVIGKNRELGKANKLLWHVPGDLPRFKKLTSNHPVIMGRKTYESIGRLLPDRINIIVTRDRSFSVSGAVIAHSVEEAIEEAKKLDDEEIFVIGGGQVYEHALPFVDKLYLTLVDASAEADTFFPDYSEFKNVVSEESHEAEGLSYKFLELKRV